MKDGLAAFVSGMIFSIGLGVSGMTDPRKVMGFLDFFGRWDPSLLLVMAGAVTVYAVGYRLAVREPRPMLGERFHIPPRGRIEPHVIVGAAIFGVGWGLAGYCPGPAVTSMASGSASPVLFVAAMLAGMATYEVAISLFARFAPRSGVRSDVAPTGAHAASDRARGQS